ncbi:MAG: hypothetical protein N3D20_02180, partial [Candidatus Pacearchaeota archaeon]|nr:hypothetical protein [Candidatus Pacearchaeota archaeon]
MVHIKYIIKNGVKYGPYYYESYREGNKVKKRYLSEEEYFKKIKKENEDLTLLKKYGIINDENNFMNFGSRVTFFSFLIILILAVFLAGYFFGIETSRVIADISTNYQKGEMINGVLKLNLRQGELIPANSKVIASLGDDKKEFLLSDLIEREKESGNYYAENVDLGGSGEGYGIKGKKEVYPYIDFELVYEKENQEGDYESGKEQSEEEINNKESEENNEVSEGSENNEGSESGITGNSILTGRVIEEDVISGRVRKGEDFIYELKEGQEVKIKKGSVKVNGKEIGDENIKIKVDGNNIKVSTDYSIEEEGFGRDYKGSGNLILEINISNFEILAENGILKIEVVYNDVLITSVEREIVVEESIVNESEEGVINETILSENISNISLTKEIERIRIAKNENYSLNLSEYFDGAEEYEFACKNISAVFDGGIMTLIPELDFVGARKGKIIAYANERGERLESNEFDILVSSGKIKIEKTRGEIKLNEKVKWVMNISLEVPENITIELPKEAENITIKKIEDGEERVESNLITWGIVGKVSAEIELRKESGFIQWVKKTFKKIISITGRAIENNEGGYDNDSFNDDVVKIVLAENVSKYVVEYYTEEPRAIEEDFEVRKKVIVMGPDGLNYTDVLTYTNVSEIISVGNEDKIKVYWVENKSYIDFEAYDLNNNGKIDYIEWITPHLSNQTFEIILITKAEHLDNNRTFIEDVYDSVKEKDGIWKEIPTGHYLRVTFAKPLVNGNDITIYARSNYSNVSIRVYEKDKNNSVGDFGIVGNENWYKIYLSNLTSEQDTFDLLVYGTGNESIEFDYVVDPAMYYNISFVAPTPLN